MDYHRPDSIGSRFRARRSGPLVAMIRAAHEQRGQVAILDVGGTREYWAILPAALLEECRVEVTLLNRDAHAAGRHEPRFTSVTGDGCDLSRYADDTFDVVHSNSVLEHVGDWSRMTAFAHEARRVGRRYFVQTPHYWFPLEPHVMCPFFHWLPRPWRVRLLMTLHLGPWGRLRSVDAAVRVVEDARLLDQKMLRALFPDAEIVVERLLGLPKSMIAVGAAHAAETERS